MRLWSVSDSKTDTECVCRTYCCLDNWIKRHWLYLVDDSLITPINKHRNKPLRELNSEKKDRCFGSLRAQHLYGIVATSLACSMHRIVHFTVSLSEIGVPRYTCVFNAEFSLKKKRIYRVFPHLSPNNKYFTEIFGLIPNQIISHFLKITHENSKWS